MSWIAVSSEIREHSLPECLIQTEEFAKSKKLRNVYSNSVDWWVCRIGGTIYTIFFDFLNTNLDLNKLICIPRTLIWIEFLEY